MAEEYVFGHDVEELRDIAMPSRPFSTPDGFQVIRDPGRILAAARTSTQIQVQMQETGTTDPAAVMDRLIREALPDPRGLGAWRSLLRAHASLMRELATDLAVKTRLPLGDFEALAVLATAGGELRMTDLASQAFSSRSAISRRVDRMVEEGLVGRDSSDSDGRAVVVRLTDAGLARLVEAVPVHLEGVSKLFLERLDDQDLAVLERALDEVSLNCSYG